MKKRLVFLALVILVALPVHAEYRQIDLSIYGMDWGLCAHAVGVALKRIKGVKTVEMKLNDGLAIIYLDSSNSVTIQALRKVIETHGFSPRDARVKVKGKVASEEGKLEIVVSHAKDRLPIIFQQGMQDQEMQIKQQAGENVVLEGRIPASEDAKDPAQIEFIRIFLVQE